MPLAHSPRAPVNIARPEPVGYCDRCSFKWPLVKLCYQYYWAGNVLANSHLRVCPTCLDEPQQNGQRIFIFGPEPKPLKDPRPGNIPQQASVPRQLILDDPDADTLDDLVELG